ncbi:MAG: M23 family metallopeptidase [Firmicutes bacterium]|nr:M23 family metallopeptidase [Bacillota bacterium]HOB34896.1 M23 family metallopeptidase [Bacillota bacterium]HPZ91136.1 M23 family metallopeptidase [Bacillota bacterium]HQE02007.1 M23 family metallopeptidase [Bacillota bacterium]
MFKLSAPGIIAAVLILALLPAGTAAAQSIEDVEAMVTELANSDYLSPELCLRYKEYKEQREQVITYVVQKGDTLTAIAAAFGVSVASIAASNGIANPHLIYPGQELKFPAVTGLLYTVAPGDELEALAEKYQIDVETIWFANALDSSELQPGSTLILPGAKLPEPPPFASVVSRSPSLRSVPGLIWPLRGRITSGFGMRGRSFHGGIDIAGPTGRPIYAAAAGVVTDCGWRGSYGYMVEIRHNEQTATLYAHASEILVKKGERVQQGQLIARVGSTGNSTGPHLHFEVRVNGRPVNPRLVLP